MQVAFPNFVFSPIKYPSSDSKKDCGHHVVTWLLDGLPQAVSQHSACFDGADVAIAFFFA